MSRGDSEQIHLAFNAKDSLQNEKINDAMKELMHNSEKTRDDTLKVLNSGISDLNKRTISPTFNLGTEESKNDKQERKSSKMNQQRSNSNQRFFTFALKDKESLTALPNIKNVKNDDQSRQTSVDKNRSSGSEENGTFQSRPMKKIPMAREASPSTRTAKPSFFDKMCGCGR